MSDFETESIKYFCKYITESTGIPAEYTVLPTTHTGKRPDFLITPHNYLVELKRITDFDEVKLTAAWGGTVTRLHKIIDAHESIKDLTGSYVVSTPFPFKLPQNEMQNKEFVSELFEKILSNDKKKFTTTIEGFRLEIERYTDEVKSISFSWNRPGHSINAPGTVNRNILSKLVDANAQLSFNLDNTEITKRITLISNQYHFARKRDVIQAFSFSLDTLKNLSTTDEIWLQQPPYNEEYYSHDLVYSKLFASELESGNLSSENYKLFEDWFWPLKELGDGYRNKLAEILVKLFKNNKPYEIFEDTYAREEMVSIATWLAENKKYKAAIALAEAFIDDPDPPADPSSISDPTRNYDLEVREGKDTIIITTVLGHLAWTIQKLTVDKSTFKKSFELTLRLANHPNLYVKLQSLVPLIEITKRRDWLKELESEDGVMPYDTFKSLVFHYLIHYSKYRSIADWLAHVFFNFRDLSTDEIILVLDKLQNAENASSLYVYYGIYRKNHFKDRKDIHFNSEVIEDKLKNVLVNNDEYPELAGGVAWQLGKIIRDNPKDLKIVKPWIELILDQQFNKSTFDDVQIILDDVYKIEPKTAVKWTMQIIDKANDFAIASNDIRSANSMWLMLEDKLEWIAKDEPEKLLEYMLKIHSLGQHGAHIGHAQTWLTTYKFVDDDELRASIKKGARQIFNEIKSVNPNVPDYDWPS